MKTDKGRTDKERIDWVEKKAVGGALVSDDNGHWAVIGDGYQTVALEKSDIKMNFYVGKDKWKDSILEAVKFYFEDIENE